MNAKQPPTLISASQKIELGDPLLSIVIPSYNHEEYIRTCIQRICSIENGDRVELIVLDDASQDKTRDVAESILKESNISYRLFCNEKNRGVTYGLNFMLHEARGKYFLACASDDFINGDALENIIQTINLEEDKIAFAIFGAEYTGNKSGKVYNTNTMADLTSNAAKFYEWVSTDIPKPLLLQSTIFNMEFLKSVDPWSDKLQLDDWPTFIKSARRALTEKFDIKFDNNVILTMYRVHDNGSHRKSDWLKKSCLEVAERTVDKNRQNTLKSRIYGHFLIGEIAQGRILRAIQSYAKSISYDPTAESIFRPPLAIGKGIARRIARIATSPSINVKSGR